MMKTRTYMLVVATVLLCAGTASHAVPPAYVGDLGNPEEPALRPFKAFWQGAKAIGHRSATAFVEGNSKTPVLGTAETFRGIRRGVVDCAEYTYRSMQGSLPPRGQEYKRQGKVNDIIDSDPCLRNGADFVAAAGTLSTVGVVSPLAGGVGIFAAQKVVDKYPAQDKATRESLKEHARDVRKARKARWEAATKPARPMGPIETAQRRYLGDRVIDNKKPAGTGDLTKLAR